MSARVTELGYVGIDAACTDRWEQWARLIGATTTDRRDGGFGIRLDSDAEARILVQPSDADAMAFAGWEVASAHDLHTIGQRLDDVGAAPQDRPDLAVDRGAEELLTFRDPDGNVGELYWGRKTLIRSRFISPHGVDFSVGQLGMGHFTIGVANFRRTLEFYTETLGMNLTEIADVGGGRVCFLRCNARHHSLAFGEIPGGTARVLHVAVEVVHLDALGSIRDRLIDNGFTIVRDLGRHPTDGVVSLYVAVGTAFEIELGWGSIEIDDTTWPLQRHQRDGWSWGHRQTPLGPSQALGSDIDTTPATPIGHTS